MAEYADLEQDPMVHICTTQDLVFRWRGGSSIDVGRDAEYVNGTERLYDQCIGVYDHATGTKTLAPDDRKGFEERCIEWCRDMYGCGVVEEEEQEEDEE